MKLRIRAFALTCGILWGLGLFIMTWWIIAFDGAGGGEIIGRVYRGYSITPMRSVVGLVWGFIDGLIGGAIFAWLYNFIAVRLPSKSE